MIKIGTYDQRIVIQRSVTEDNGSGGTWNVWQTVRETWAKVVPKEGSRTLEGSEQVLTDTAIIQIRRNEEHSLSKAYQIIWRGENYQIESIRELEAGHWVWELKITKTGNGFIGLLGTPIPESIIETPLDQNIQIP